jgi:hypothetical protein
MELREAGTLPDRLVRDLVDSGPAAGSRRDSTGNRPNGGRFYGTLKAGRSRLSWKAAPSLGGSSHP